MYDKRVVNPILLQHKEEILNKLNIANMEPIWIISVYNSFEQRRVNICYTHDRSQAYDIKSELENMSYNTEMKGVDVTKIDIDMFMENVEIEPIYQIRDQ